MLRRITAEDALRVYEIQSNWNVARMLRRALFPPTLDDIRRWLTPHEGEWVSGIAYRFAVVLGDRLVGCTDVDEISHASGELGYWLDESFWGRGIATEAVEAMLRFAVTTVGLKRLSSGHAIDNPASGRILTKLGFSPTGETKLGRGRDRKRSSTANMSFAELRTADAASSSPGRSRFVGDG
jgi:RimJ/RimL family protein N-acetyltransferase